MTQPEVTNVGFENEKSGKRLKETRPKYESNPVFLVL